MNTTTLTAAQREAYERDGYVVLPAVFTPDEIAEMTAEADRLAELTVNASIATGELSPRLDVQRRGGHVILRKVQPVSDISEVLTRYTGDERLVGPLRQILGCDPVLMEEKLNYKQILPGPPPIEASVEGEAFPFHTDLAFFYLDGYPVETLSSAITMDEMTADNGPLRMLPRSHTRLDWPLQGGWPPWIRDDAIPHDELVDVLAPAGSVLIFSSALVHASSENRTPNPRRLLIFSHYPETHDVEPDKRNRHLREAGSAHERRYTELLARGAYSPAFRMR